MDYGNIPIDILCIFTVDNLHDNSSQFKGVQYYNTILNTRISKNNHLLDLYCSKFDCRDNMKKS